jgi:hypothetical protein
MNEKYSTPLERVEATGSLQALQRDPSKVIRSERFSDLQNMYGDAFECVELAAIANRLYAELEALYGISVPTNIIVDRDDEGEIVIAQAVDRIDGVSLEQAESTSELAEKVEVLYTSIARYLYEKSNSDDYYLTDLNNPSQYMFGRKPGEHQARLHLVDTDIYLNKGRERMYLVMEWLARHMSGVERQCGARFDEARQYIQKFVEESKIARDSDHKVLSVKHNLDNITAYLQGGKFGPPPEKGIPDFAI